MRIPLISLAFALALGLAVPDVDARRFGGGGNLGKQRATPTQREAATPAKPAQANPAQPAAAPASAAAAAKPSFMSRWGGMLAGLGIGMLLASIFGAQLAPFVAMLLLALLVGGIGYLLFRLLSPRRPAAVKPAQFAGIGSAVAPPVNVELEGGARTGEIQPRTLPSVPEGFAVEPFVRVAKTSFLRLQAANDARDLDDIRDYTSPEMYAEIAMQIKERGETPQKTEVVSLDAKLIEVAVEDGYEIASVRFWGLIRENANANPESFDEVWHVRKKANDRRAPWLIAGIQQTE